MSERTAWERWFERWGDIVMFACMVVMALALLLGGCQCHVVINSEPTTQR